MKFHVLIKVDLSFAQVAELQTTSFALEPLL